MRALRPIFAAAVLFGLAACNLSTEPNVPAPIDPAQDTYAPALGVDIASMTKTSSGLYYKDKVAGTGDVVAAVGDSIRFNYTLWLTNGTKVESSKDPGGSPAEFRIGDRAVIAGFSEGFVGMKPGGVRQLVVPPHLGWSTVGSGPVQPNANIVFEIEYLSKF